VRRIGFAVLFVLGFGAAGATSAAVVAETTTGTTSTATTATSGTTPTGTTSTGTTATTTTGTTTTAPPAPLVLPSGVRVAGVSVGGLTAEAATALLQESFQQPLDLRVAGRRLTPRAEALGAVAYVRGAVARARLARPGTTVPLVVGVKGAAVHAYVARLAKRFERAPVDASLTLRSLQPFVTKDAPGRRLDRNESARLIIRALRANRRAPVKLPLRAVAPEVTRKSFGAVIVIHRGSNRLFLYRGMSQWRTFGVATGQSIYPTPLGHFQVAVKWRNPWWYPPDSAWAQGLDPVPPGPGNPLGTRWMGLSAPGIGIHGTPDSASIGYSASHGCIRMLVPQAEWLFDHVDIGTPVFIVSP
jgi:lipoprotein-anchoring transpeptidase ErfK/SrfK